MHVSIVTTCKGYRRHLECSLPAMLAQECPEGVTFDVVVVDYGCPDGTYEWLPFVEAQGQEHRLRGVFVVEPGELFNGPRARNIGAREAPADVLFFCDADDIPPPSALREGVEQIKAGNQLVNWTRTFPGIAKPSCFGAAMVVREIWSAVRGFDECLGCRYGYDDSDFYRRVANDYDFARIPAIGWNHCQQDHGEATRFYETSDVEVSLKENQRRIWERGGLINVGGFGVADVHRFSALPEFEGWMSWSELAWLHDRASRLTGPATWAEIGVYLGRSLHRVGLALPHGSTLIGVDTFDSVTSPEMPHVGTWDRFGKALDDLRRRRPDLELVLLTPGAADLLPPLDGLFIDALHTPEAIAQDLDKYTPRVRPGGIIAGHDYYPAAYPGLCEVIDRRFPGRTIQHTIWETRQPI